MPVICGGTNYYIESLLWDVLVETKGDTSTMEPITKKFKKDDVSEEAELDSKELYEKLKQIDPDRANELHPNDRRKIVRSLQGKLSLVWTQRTIYTKSTFKQIYVHTTLSLGSPEPLKFNERITRFKVFYEFYFFLSWLATYNLGCLNSQIMSIERL